MRRCPNCRRQVDAGERVCNLCDEPLPQDTKRRSERDQRPTREDRQSSQTRGNRDPGGSTVGGERGPTRGDSSPRQRRTQSTAGKSGNAPSSRNNRGGQPQNPQSQMEQGQSGQPIVNTPRTATSRRGGWREQPSSGPDAVSASQRTRQQPGSQRRVGQQGGVGYGRGNKAALGTQLGIGFGTGALVFLLGLAARWVTSLLVGAVSDNPAFTVGSGELGAQEILVDHVIAHPVVLIQSSNSGADGTTILQELPAAAVVFIIFVGFFVVAGSYGVTRQFLQRGFLLDDAKLAVASAIGYTAVISIIAVTFEAEIELPERTVTLAAEPLTAALSGFVFGGILCYAGFKLNSVSKRGANIVLAGWGIVCLLLVILGLTAV